MRHRLPALVLAALFLLPTVPLPAAADTPTHELRAHMDRVFDALRAREQRVALRAATAELFDWPELAHLSLGPHWQMLTDAERAEFTRLLGRLVDTRLLALAEYGATTVEYVDEDVEGERATVRTAVAMAAGRGLALDYRMVQRAGRWLVYDVVVDGTSMAASYRAQFARIIKKTSFAALVEKLATP
ncbi:MAG: ABC transporter substrate-binding protein [Candidatus Rokubacteria bacterium]|nr:ABC transporter substrate-binding protein [Candidatus Rokubacteria bacterium]